MSLALVPLPYNAILLVGVCGLCWRREGLDERSCGIDELGRGSTCQCSLMNMLWTGLAGAAVTLQPLVCAVFFYKTHERCDFYKTPEQIACDPPREQYQPLEPEKRHDGREFVTDIISSFRGTPVGAEEVIGADAIESDLGNNVNRRRVNGTDDEEAAVPVSEEGMLVVNEDDTGRVAPSQPVRGIDHSCEVDYQGYPERDRFLLVYLSAIFTSVSVCSMWGIGANFLTRDRHCFGWGVRIQPFSQTRIARITRITLPV